MRAWSPFLFDSAACQRADAGADQGAGLGVGMGLEAVRRIDRVAAGDEEGNAGKAEYKFAHCSDSFKRTVGG
ncbi:MAG: hypothetical protein WDN06_03310 [Asticcacaulis sp.]